MYTRILVPVDGSPASNAGLAEAVKVAKLTGAQIRLLHVVDENPFLTGSEAYGALAGDVLNLLREAGEDILQDARTRVTTAGVAVDTAMFDSLSGRLSDRVMEQVAEWGADLVVIGTHGRRGVRRMMLGSDAEQILRTAQVPVLLVREGG
ncbi:MAG: universal stress protein [Caldimonas sp.]